MALYTPQGLARFHDPWEVISTTSAFLSTKLRLLAFYATILLIFFTRVQQRTLAKLRSPSTLEYSAMLDGIISTS